MSNGHDHSRNTIPALEYVTCIICALFDNSITVLGWYYENGHDRYSSSFFELLTYFTPTRLMKKLGYLSCFASKMEKKKKKKKRRMKRKDKKKINIKMKRREVEMKKRQM